MSDMERVGGKDQNGDAVVEAPPDAAPDHLRHPGTPRDAVSRSNPMPGHHPFAYVPSIFGGLFLILLTIGGVYLLARLQFLIILLFLSVLVACGISDPVRWLERRGLGRALAILLVYALIGAVLAGIGWYALPRLVGQAGAVAEDLPAQFAEAQRFRQRLVEMQADYPILGDLDARLIEITEDAGASATEILLDLPAAVATAVFAVTSILTLAFLLLLTWREMRSTAMSLIEPRHRAQTEQVLAEIGERLGAYLRAKLIIMVIVGAWVYGSLALLGSPYAVLTAIFAGTMEVLPRIGPWIGRAAIVLAAAPLGWQAIAIAVLAHVVIENIKGYVLSPVIEGSQVDIHPLTAFIAVIAGGLLLGWIGALVAVPAAAVIQVIVEDVLIPWRRRRVALAEPTANPR